MELKARGLIRDVPDFPKPGIIFKDITPVLQDADAVREIVHSLAEFGRAVGAEAVAAIEARGFIFGAPLALALAVPFVPVRKPGKLPAATVREEYELEYGTDSLEIHRDAFAPGTRVLVVDDLLATGGTAAATARLIKRLGAVPCGAAFVIELEFLKGRVLLGDLPVRSLIVYE